MTEELGEAERILTLLAAKEFNQAKQKLERVTDAIVAIRVARFGPFTGRPFIQDTQASPEPAAAVASDD